jgi:putative serine protease PepD
MSAQTLERPPEPVPWPAPAPPVAPPPRDGGGGSGGRRSWPRRLVTVAAIASLGLGSGLAGGYAATELEHDPATTVATTPASTQATTGTGSLAGVAAAVSPSVVSIVVQAAGEQVEGSGVVVGSDGLIVTNNHVVAGAAQGGNRVKQVVRQLTGGVQTVSARSATG